MNLTDRQRIALEHPTDRSDGVLRTPPPDVSRKHGKWLSILEVAREPGGPWVWMASISRQRGHERPYKVSEWKPEWRPIARDLLEALLESVGGEPIDPDTQARKVGIDPGSLAGYHMWRLLTRAEITVVEARILEGT